MVYFSKIKILFHLGSKWADQPEWRLIDDSVEVIILQEHNPPLWRQT